METTLEAFIKKGRPQHSNAGKRRFGPGRNQLLDAQANRGHRLNNLWCHYSARLQRDVILTTDAQFAHFCWLEGDPNVRLYELEPEPLVAAENKALLSIRFNARVTLRQGRPQLHEVKSESPEPAQLEIHKRVAEAAGFDYVCVTRIELEKHQQLILNWRRALAFLAACRELVLSPFCTEIRSTVQRERRASIDAVLMRTDPALRSIYLGSIFKSIQEGWLSSDLDAKPLCVGSTLWLAESGHE